MNKKSAPISHNEISAITNPLGKKFSKLFLIYLVSISFIASTVFFIYSYNTQKTALYAAINKEIASTVQSASLAAYTIDKMVGQHMLDGLVRRPEISYAHVLLEDDSVLARSGSLAANQDSLTLRLFPELKKFEADLIFNIRDNHFNVGKLIILPNYAEAKNTILHNLRNGITLIFVISMILYFAVRHLINKELSAPIISLAQQISSLEDIQKGEGDHNLDTPDKHSTDEIGYLIDNFNSLFRSLKETKSYASTIEDTLETTEAQYTAMVANTFEIFMRLTENGEIEFVNPAIKSILKYSLNEVINTNLKEYVLESSAEELQHFIDDVIHGRAEEPTRALHFKTKDGEERILSCSINNALDIDKINSLLFIARDITKSYKTEMELRQAQKLESIGKLTGGIAHDFNNILTIIINNIEFVQSKIKKANIKDGAPMHDLLETALNAGFTGADLTARLLAFARNQPLNPDSFKPNARIKNIIPLLERTIGNHITIKAELDSHIGHVKIDRSQFENALLNLCINARDAIPTDKIGLITLKTSPADTIPNIETAGQQYILVEVMDNGSGISPENLKKVIDPFFTTKDIGKGTGLGLSMVYGFVHQSKGHFNIVSDVGKGTTIQMYFPKQDMLKSDAANDHIIEEEINEDYDGSGKTVLILEDNPTVADIIEKLLQDMHFTVIKTNSSTHALAACEEYRPDIILSDVLLQNDMTGFQFADQVLVQTPQQIIVHMSGYTDPENTLKNTAYSVELRKPFRRSDLVNILQRKLDAKT
jgi:PAS domain S-box-containing protein